MYPYVYVCGLHDIYVINCLPFAGENTVIKTLDQGYGNSESTAEHFDLSSTSLPWSSYTLYTAQF